MALLLLYHYTQPHAYALKKHDNKKKNTELNSGAQITYALYTASVTDIRHTGSTHGVMCPGGRCVRRCA